MAATVGFQMTGESLASLQKNPISALMEYGQARHIEARIEIINERGPPHQPVFAVAAFVGDRKFPSVESTTKKEGRLKAAERALRILNAEESSVAPQENEKTAEDGPAMTNGVDDCPVPGKHPVSAFMEYSQYAKVTARFEFLGQRGPPHMPMFTVASFLGDRQFPSAESNNKSDARKKAAIIALSTLRKEGELEDWTPTGVAPANQATVASKDDESAFVPPDKNPVSMLMEYAQSNRQTARVEALSQEGPPHQPVFTMAAYLDDRQFPTISAKNKKEGKAMAALEALKTLKVEGKYFPQHLISRTKMSDPSSCKTHFDRMAAVSHSAFGKLVATIPEGLVGRKVIAAIIMELPDEQLIVVSIGSGNRCITGEHLSLEGNVVNDSHAEIIAKRGLQRFLYKQLVNLDLAGSTNPGSILKPSAKGKFAVKDGVTFHLYISTAPCGDGALFAQSDSEDVHDSDIEDHHPVFTNEKQGQLRTKLEKGEGTIPVEADFPGQTWDGIKRGERLRTMSCSDKICRWNVMGIQGALLTHFLDPIYLTSVTLGQLYHHGHLSRALCCRLSREQDDINVPFAEGYALHHPDIGKVTACTLGRDTEKARALSINWALGDDNAEVTDGALGACYASLEKQRFSRLSKRNMFEAFRACATMLSRKHLLELGSYCQTKEAACNYQQAKKALYNGFQMMKYGTWVAKPKEQEQFQWCSNYNRVTNSRTTNKPKFKAIPLCSQTEGPSAKNNQSRPQGRQTVNTRRESSPPSGGRNGANFQSHGDESSQQSKDCYRS